MTKANKQSCNRFDSSIIFTIKNMRVGLIDLRILFLKAIKILTFRMLWPRLFHSITAERKKRIIEKVMFSFEKGCVFSISSGVRDCHKGTNLERYRGHSFL